MKKVYLLALVLLVFLFLFFNIQEKLVGENNNNSCGPKANKKCGVGRCCDNKTNTCGGINTTIDPKFCKNNTSSAKNSKTVSSYNGQYDGSI